MSKRLLMPRIGGGAEKVETAEPLSVFWKGEEGASILFTGLPINGAVLPSLQQQTPISIAELINGLKSVQKKDSALFRTPWTIGGNRPPDSYETKGRPLLHPKNFVESAVALLNSGNCLKPLENLLFGAMLTCTVVKDDVWEFALDYEGFAMNKELEIVKNKRLADEKILEECVFRSGLFEYMLPYLIAESWERPAPLVFLLHFVCYSDLLHKTILKTPNLVDDLDKHVIGNNTHKAMISMMVLAILLGTDKVRFEKLNAATTKSLSSFYGDFKKIVENRPSKFQLSEMLRSLRALLTVKSTRAFLATQFRMKLPLMLEGLIAKNEPILVEHLIACLAQIAFDEEQLTVLRTNKTLLERLQKIKQMPGGEDTAWLGAAREAEGLIWTLSNMQNERVVVNNNSPVDETAAAKRKVMISYNWQHKELAVKMAEYLRREDFQVWQDVSDMKGDIMTAMAKAVQESDIVLVLVSTGYFASANCQRECTYAASLKKKLVPFFVEPGYVPADWLGILISGLLYYEISLDRLESVLALAVRNELRAGAGGEQKIGLHSRPVDSLESKVEQLQRENEELKRRMDALERRVMQLGKE